MNLTKLILKGRVDPIVEDRTFDGTTKKCIVGYRRKGKIRKHGEWTLRKPIPLDESPKSESQPATEHSEGKEVSS